MPYSPPVGDASLNLSGSYATPVGVVNLDLSPPGDDRNVCVGARTGGARANLDTAYDPNLLSDVVLMASDRWSEGALSPLSFLERFQDGALIPKDGLDRWQEADSAPSSHLDRWQDSVRLSGSGLDRWQEAVRESASWKDFWQPSERVVQGGVDRWQEAGFAGSGFVVHWVDLPRVTLELLPRWQESDPLHREFVEEWQDGALLAPSTIERWQEAGYPGNAPNPGPSLPDGSRGIAYPDGVNLLLCRPPASTALKLGTPPCTCMGWWNVPVKRMYRVINSCSLVRLPDLTPLPVLSMTIETDSKSWCWSLSATLMGAEAWSLIEPQSPAYLPREVQATINGHTWKFVLDLPNRSRTFNSNRVSLPGRSRSAWMDEPYDPRAIGYNAEIRSAQQIADEIIEFTGWTIDWQIDDWLIQAKRWERDNTKITALKRLINPVRGLLYTDPAEQIMTIYPEYKVASWLWEGEVADVSIPEAAILGWTEKPDFNIGYNGVYVSGTSHGVLAFIKIAGTDGAITPGQPIVEALCCDDNGVAARMRGLAELSAGGPGYTLTANLLLTEEGDTSGPGLLHPGQLVLLNCLMGMVRGVSVVAEWNEGLTVRQTITVERKEVTV